MTIRSLFFFLIMLLTACTSQKAHILLSEAEKAANANPRFALELLDTADSSLFRSRKLYADKSILYVQALEKSGEKTDYSIIIPAFSYYKSRKPMDKRTYVWYAMGKYQMNEGKYTESLVSFIKAQTYSLNNSDESFLSRLSLAMGDNYGKGFLYDEALIHYSQAVNHAEKAKDTSLLITALYAEARTHNNLKNYNRADTVFHYLLKQHSMNPALFNRVMADYALMNVEHEHNYIMGQILYNKAISENHSFGSYNHWGAYAYALEQTGNPQEANHLLKALEQKRRDSLYSSLVWKSRILAHRSDYKSAYELLEQAATIRSDNIRKALRNSVLRAHSDYYEQAYENARHINKLSRVVILLLFLLLITGVHAAFSFYRRKQASIRIREASMLETASMLSNQLENFRKERILLQDHFVKIHQNHLKEFGSLLKTTLGADETNIGFKQINLYEKARKTMDEIVADKQGKRVFEDRLNESFDNVMVHLRNEHPNHTEDYYRFAGFVFAGFDNETLMSITGSKSLDSIYAKKRRLKQDILRSDTKHRSLFLHLI